MAEATPNPEPTQPDPAPTPASPAPSPPAPPSPPSPEPAPAAAASKPDGLSDDFWDAAKGEVKFGDISQRLNDLTAFKAEHDSRSAQIPEKPEDYSLELPQDFEMPDGVEFSLDADSPLATEARAMAHELKLTGGEFGKLLQLYAKDKIHEHQQMQGLADKETEKLGPKAKERVDAVTAWLEARIGGDASKTLYSQMYTASQIEAWEKLMGQFRSAGMPGAGGSGSETGGPADLSEEERQNMSFEQRVHRAREIADQEKARAGGRR